MEKLKKTKNGKTYAGFYHYDNNANDPDGFTYWDPDEKAWIAGILDEFEPVGELS